MQNAVFESTRQPSRIAPLLRDAQAEVGKAKQALSDGQTQSAFDTLTAFADRASTVDERLPALLRTELWRLLRNHGLSGDLSGLKLAQVMLRDALDQMTEDTPSQFRGQATGHLETLGAVIARQQNSVSALRLEAARIPPDAPPRVLASAQINIGEALIRGLRFREAQATFENVLRIVTVGIDPTFWAQTKVRLGQVALRLGDPARAVEDFRAALVAVSELSAPEVWADAQARLSWALISLGRQSDTDESIWQLVQGIAAARAGLRVYLRDRSALDWARMQELLGRGEFAIAEHGSTSMPPPHLRAAVEHFDAALKVFGSHNLDALRGVTDLSELRALRADVQASLAETETDLSESALAEPS